MDFFSSIKKRWIQSKANKYALKRQEALSKSLCYQQLASDYSKRFKAYSYSLREDARSFAQYSLKSASEQNLANKYLDKLIALDEKYGISKDYEQKADYYRYLADLYDDKKKDLEEHKG